MSDSIYDLFKTDKNLEKDGKWVSFGPSQFLIARAGGSNTKFVNAYATAMKPYQRQQQLGKLSPDEQADIAKEPFVDFCVLDWRWKNSKEDAEVNGEFLEHQIKGKDGEFVTFSKDAAKKLLGDIPELFGILFEAAAAISTFAPADQEAAAKNS